MTAKIIIKKREKYNDNENNNIDNDNENEYREGLETRRK